MITQKLKSPLLTLPQTTRNFYYDFCLDSHTTLYHPQLTQLSVYNSSPFTSPVSPPPTTTTKMDSLTSTKTKNQCLIQQNNDLESISRSTTFTIMYSFPSSRSGMYSNGRFQEQQPYFLDACFRCKKPLGCNKDIFMYRGDTPFCSEVCRSQQIEIDETKEKKRSLSASVKALRKKQEREKNSNSSSPDYPFRSDAVAAA